MPNNQVPFDPVPNFEKVRPSRAAFQSSTTIYNDPTVTYSSSTQKYGGGDSATGDFPNNLEIINL